MSVATTYMNKEGEDWSRAVATSHFYKENNTNTLGYEGYLQEEDKQAQTPTPRPRPPLLRGVYKDYTTRKEVKFDFKNMFDSQVLEQLKNNAEDNETFIEWYCEKCKHNDRHDREMWNDMFSSGIESINKDRYNCLQEGKFFTKGCDNCL